MQDGRMDWIEERKVHLQISCDSLDPMCEKNKAREERRLLSLLLLLQYILVSPMIVVNAILIVLAYHRITIHQDFLLKFIMLYSATSNTLRLQSHLFNFTFNFVIYIGWWLKKNSIPHSKHFIANFKSVWRGWKIVWVYSWYQNLLATVNKTRLERE